MKKTIHKFISKHPGPTVAVFCGIHGNEKAGIMAVERYLSRFEPEKGCVYFVLGNPRAAKLNVRFTEKNLNRCFLASNDEPTSYEEKRARKLMEILNGCDALLDLHGYNSTEDQPFVICEERSFSLAQQLDVGVVVSNLANVSNGSTDAYMHRQGRVGICIECGSNYFAEKYLDFATEAITAFLNYYGVTSTPSKKRSNRKQRVLRALRVVKKETHDFAFDKDYKNFDRLKAGAVFARDGKKSYVAPEDAFIIFPRAKQIVGHEAFVLAEELSPST